jgi:23S rRNA pseudouridine2605 synthase
MEERLQKILSRSGVASRRKAEDLMAEGRVMVNGVPVKSLGTKADVSRDDIRVDGVRVRPPKERVYLLLNKPRGVVTTRHDPEGRTTVMSLVPSVSGLFPVGRLDVNTEGLILLTNDGAFAEQVLHPRYEVARVYHAKVRGVLEPKTLARLRQGLVIEGERLSLDHVRVLEAANNSWLEVTLHEGKHHEVRRLLEGVGHPVSKLRRVGIGPLSLRGLETGEFRHLTPREIEGLLRPRARPSRPAAATRRPTRGKAKPRKRSRP